jgi:hypothetical protein
VRHRPDLSKGGDGMKSRVGVWVRYGVLLVLMYGLAYAAMAPFKR